MSMTGRHGALQINEPPEQSVPMSARLMHSKKFQIQKFTEQICSLPDEAIVYTQKQMVYF